MITLWAVLGTMAAGWLLATTVRGADGKALYFVAGITGYPIACVGLGLLLEISGVKIMAFGFIALVGMAIYVMLRPDDSSATEG
ncbi:hypothetical protein [Stutzerimonas stutzeri]|uniref:hypothetical protein n=1 Tax=Stutzerimonas stutzeri TaxID=316 RepID=UPI001186924A|nr:hypothetical protein [Stutzerimonas stutzeri]